MSNSTQNPQHGIQTSGNAADKSAELRLRIISALVLAAVAISVTLIGNWSFSIMIALLGVMISREWLVITSSKSVEDDVLGTAIYWVLFTLSMTFVLAGEPWIAVLAFGASALVLLIWTVVAKSEMWMAPGLIYVGIPMAALYAIRNQFEGQGAGLIFLLFAFVWATDIFAYFAGRKFGGAKLLPSVSPNKTWSGFFGGLVAAAICAAIASFFLVSIGFWAGLAAGVLISVVSQAGDLFESALKRRFGVKDSGNVIPGHGGFMDRVDGFVFAAVAASLILL